MGTRHTDVKITADGSVTLRVELTLCDDEDDCMQFDDGLLTGEVFDDTGLYRAWPASSALCRWMLKNPEVLAHKRVLELGAGTGLPSLLATQHCDAQQVLATDMNAQALAKLDAAATKAGQRLRTACLSFDDAAAVVELAAAERVEVVMLADVVYPAKDFAPLLRTLQSLLRMGREGGGDDTGDDSAGSDARDDAVDGGNDDEGEQEEEGDARALYPPCPAPPPTILIALTRRDALVHAAFEEGLRALAGASLALLATDRSEADPLYGTAVDVQLYRLSPTETGARGQTRVGRPSAPCTNGGDAQPKARGRPSFDAQGGSSRSWRLAAAALRLWPEEPPPGVAAYHHGWVHAGNERMLRRLIGEIQPRVVLELGSWLGLCTSLLLEATRGYGGSVFAVDRWDGAYLLETQRAQYERDVEALTLLGAAPRAAGGEEGGVEGGGLSGAASAGDPAIATGGLPLFETFVVNMWEERTRLFPLRMDTCDGIEAIRALGAPVELVYVDADHSRDAVSRELAALEAAFPAALVCGDDWQWPEVREAVEAHVQARAGMLQLHSHPAENWWWLQSLRTSAQGAEAEGQATGTATGLGTAGSASGTPTPRAEDGQRAARTKVDFVGATDGQ